MSDIKWSGPTYSDLTDSKDIDVYGRGFTIPVEYCYVAVDSNGWVRAYCGKPIEGFKYWYLIGKGDSVMLGHVYLGGVDWRTTLREV